MSLLPGQPRQQNLCQQNLVQWLRSSTCQPCQQKGSTRVVLAIATVLCVALPPLAQAQETFAQTPTPSGATNATTPNAASPNSATTPGTTQTPATQTGGSTPGPDLPPVPNLPVGAPPKPVPGAPVNPLELNQPDPLLPPLLINRPLSPQERDVLTAALTQRDQQAQARYKAGDIPGALDLWNRELRLRRFLGVREEVASLSKVGEVAWRESQVTEVRVITQRLQQIQQEVQARPRPAYDLLLSIAQAYQQMRAQSQAISLYNQLLITARQRQDAKREQQILAAQADLYLAWFDYPNAAATYQRLLTLARARKDSANEIVYTQQLAYVYQQNNQFPQAIAAQQRLVDIYRRQKNFVPIPALKLAIGDEYVALNRPDLAASSYQESFATARSTQAYGYASDALQRLATLYDKLKRPDDTLVVYQLLLDVQQQSYNTLGMLNTYDLIGQTYRTQGKKEQAIAAFRQGLQIAQRLNYKISYFNTQINQTVNPPPPTPPAGQPPANPAPTSQTPSGQSSATPASTNSVPATQPVAPAVSPSSTSPSVNPSSTNSQPNTQPPANPLLDTNPPFDSKPPGERSSTSPASK
jgi:tetratricopeptide (TPR) repeat protein